MVQNKPRFPEDYPKGIHNELYNIESMSDEQLNAIHGIVEWLWSLDHNMVHYSTYKRLSGYAGTGKSICITYLLTYKNELLPDWVTYDKNVAICTYTWKAALVLQERGIDNACSIHSIFYDTDKDNKDSNLSFKAKPPEDIRDAISFIIVDEASMVGFDIRNDLFLTGIPILFVGDAGQLPPIGDGTEDGTGKYFMEDSEFNLTEIRRQALDNPIIALSLLIRQGKRIPYGDFMGKKKVFHISSDKLTDKLLLSADQILCGKNKTRSYINRRIRTLKGIDTRCYPAQGEKIIGLNNDVAKGVFNGQQWVSDEDYTSYLMGDSNIRISMKFSNEREKRVTSCLAVSTQEEVTSFLRKEAFDQGFYIVDFGYAITVHKAQGSSFPKVIVINERLSSNKSDHIKWLYTAVTRATDKLIIVS